MTLNEWEQNNIEVLTSREMGEWLSRRENRLLEQIRAEMQATAEMHEDGDYYLRDEWIDEYFDKYTKGV